MLMFDDESFNGSGSDLPEVKKTDHDPIKTVYESDLIASTFPSLNEKKNLRIQIRQNIKYLAGSESETYSESVWFCKKIYSSTINLCKLYENEKNPG